MSMHSGRIYRNSCIKTPTDSGNNYAIQSSCNKTSKRLDTLNSIPPNCSKTKNRPSTTVRRLAKFYDSIPDYSEIHHLEKKDFETTLDYLRTTCQSLKNKVQSPISRLQEDTSYSSLSSLQPCKSKTRKKVHKTRAGKKKSTRQCLQSCDNPCQAILCKSRHTCAGSTKYAELTPPSSSAEVCQTKILNSLCKRKVGQRNLEEPCSVEEACIYTLGNNSEENLINKSCKAQAERRKSEENLFLDDPFQSTVINSGREYILTQPTKTSSSERSPTAENCLLDDLCNQSCIAACEYNKFNKACKTKLATANYEDLCTVEAPFEETFVDPCRKNILDETNKIDATQHKTADEPCKLQEEMKAKKYAEELFSIEDKWNPACTELNSKEVAAAESSYKFQEECFLNHSYARSCKDIFCNTTYKPVDKNYLPYDINPSNCIYPCEENILNERRFKSFKDDCKREVEAFRQTLREFEREIKRPMSTIHHSSSVQQPTKVNEETQTDLNTECAQNLEQPEYKTCEKVNETANVLSESMKKSLSLNDVHAVRMDDFAKEERKRFVARLARIEKHNSKHCEHSCPTSKIEGLKLDAISKTSPKVRPFSCTKKKKRAKSEENYKLPYSCFLPSPVHAVARPNLAATLRAQVCKEKLKQRRTNCTFSDDIKHFDWEVRKTPAWKSLSLQETHDQTLMLRLATRKAEQALQQRQYEMNLELMRQRVKTAPLLLEGETHWPSNVGKLTHHCYEEGQQHICKSRSSNSRQRIRKKKSQSQLDGFCAHHKSELLAAKEVVNRSESESRLSNKLDSVKKIYARSGKSITPQPIKDKSQCKKKHKTASAMQIESEDELSSVDRAYL